MSRGTPVASLMVLGPCIEVKSVKGDPLSSDRDYSYVRAHIQVKAVFVHAEIIGSIPQSDESRRGD
jgi:hypothetical protein